MVPWGAIVKAIQAANSDVMGDYWDPITFTGGGMDVPIKTKEKMGGGGGADSSGLAAMMTQYLQGQGQGQPMGGAGQGGGTGLPQYNIGGSYAGTAGAGSSFAGLLGG
ncbi:hypothetical protein FACS1894186_4910 [Alphaproteobacteria bacterium]|nr:hypothetical protein FACS1894186_4910 [Alphaproteobacteria bacterium]